MTPRKKVKVVMTRIIRDCRDSRKDYEMPADLANEMYDDGKLVFDEMNGCYAHHYDERDNQPKWRV